MTSEELRQWIDGGESLNVEFKGEERSPLSDRELVEAVVCMANRPSPERALVLIGVEDDGRITGAQPRHETGTINTEQVQALIANRTRPSLFCTVEIVEIEHKPVLVIEVPRADQPVGTANGTYKRRARKADGMPQCLPFHFHEMQAMLASRRVLDYSALVVPEACWEHLDPLEFERFRRFIRESHGQGESILASLPDLELAKVLGAVEANHQVVAVRVLALLLFGREDALKQFLPTHEVAFQVLKAPQVEVNDFFRWPLLRVMDEILSRFRARNREKELMVGLLRVGMPDYPERAFREGVVNAFVHRDYTRMGAINIQWFEDRIEISNPGGFPEGMHLSNILSTPPRPRNPLLADAFKRVGIVERTGRGIDTIFFEQLRNGRPAPSYDRTTETDVVLVLFGGEVNLDFVRLIVEENQRGFPLRLEALLVLNELWRRRHITTPDAARLIQRSETDARAVLERLVEVGLVESRGERKGRSYHLSAATYRRLGKEAAYVRQRGFDSLQQEQMVLQYVEEHGRITRWEAAELCRITGPQAYRLLDHLVQQGLLARRGKRGRGVTYTRAK